jgi:hypothetical protein
MSNLYFPFHALGFCCNPFRALTDDEWAQIALLPANVDAIMRNGFKHLQILGNPGYGKTTILLALAARFRTDGKRIEYEYLPEGQSYFTTDCNALAVFLLDEAQRLTPSERERLVSIATRTQLIIASHEDLTPLFASHQHALTSVQIENLDTDVLRAILSRRLDYFRLDDSRNVISREQSDREISILGTEISRRSTARNDNQIDFTPDAIAYLSNVFGGNLRAMEQFLYEIFQNLDSITLISKSFLIKDKTPRLE